MGVSTYSSLAVSPARMSIWEIVIPIVITVGSATFWGLLDQKYNIASVGMMNAAVKTSSGVIGIYCVSLAIMWIRNHLACMNARLLASRSALLRSQISLDVIEGNWMRFSLQRWWIGSTFSSAVKQVWVGRRDLINPSLLGSCQFRPWVLRGALSSSYFVVSGLLCGIPT